MRRAADINDWIRSLHELGCSDEMAVQVVKLIQADDMDRAAELLRRHKKLLLDELHHSEQKVDLMDFLLYQLKKTKNGRDGILNGDGKRKIKLNNGMGQNFP